MIKIKQRMLNMGLHFLILALILMAFALKSTSFINTMAWNRIEACLEPGEVIHDGKLEDSAAYTIISSSGEKDYGDLFVVFRKKPNQPWMREYTNDFKALKPWKLELGDVDGDGIREILIAVKKKTHFDEAEKNRMFLFQYDGDKLVKKWTGSQTKEEWNDFLVGDLLPIKGEELIFTEGTDNGAERLSIYYWFDFGFVRLAESEIYKDILSLTIIEENHIRMTYLNGRRSTSVMTVRDGKIISVSGE